MTRRGWVTVYSCCRWCQTVQFINYSSKYWTVQQNDLCDSEFQTEGALTLKALADNKTAILSTDNNSLSADHSVCSAYLSHLIHDYQPGVTVILVYVTVPPAASWGRWQTCREVERWRSPAAMMRQHCGWSSWQRRVSAEDGYDTVHACGRTPVTSQSIVRPESSMTPSNFTVSLSGTTTPVTFRSSAVDVSSRWAHGPHSRNFFRKILGRFLISRQLKMTDDRLQ